METQVPAGGLSRTQPGWRRFLRAVYRKVFRFNASIVPDLAPGRMLEVGCASGAYLASMAAQGWHAEGIEFSEDASAQARRAGLAVQTGSLETAVAQKNSFDLIVAWMVIEHLHQPVRALRKLHEWAKPGAWLCFSVPDAGAAEFRVFGGAWYALHLPNHLYHFTPATIRRLLEQTGWSVERVFHQRTLGNLIGSLGNWLEDRRAPAGIHRALQRFPETSGRKGLVVLYPLAWLLSLVGQTGRMTVWARKLPQ